LTKKRDKDRKIFKKEKQGQKYRNKKEKKGLEKAKFLKETGSHKQSKHEHT
jgi:hypothetical protein